MTIATESSGFLAYFGETPTFLSSAVDVNGNDPIELFLNGLVVDVFGEVNVDGTGQPWEYLDGFAYRTDGSLPNSFFQISQWNLSGTNALDGCNSNAACGSIFPLKSFGVGVALPTSSPTKEVSVFLDHVHFAKCYSN